MRSLIDYLNYYSANQMILPEMYWFRYANLAAILSEAERKGGEPVIKEEFSAEISRLFSKLITEFESRKFLAGEFIPDELYWPLHKAMKIPYIDLVPYALNEDGKPEFLMRLRYDKEWRHQWAFPGTTWLPHLNFVNAVKLVATARVGVGVANPILISRQEWDDHPTKHPISYVVLCEVDADRVSDERFSFHKRVPENAIEVHAGFFETALNHLNGSPSIACNL